MGFLIAPSEATGKSQASIPAPLERENGQTAGTANGRGRNETGGVILKGCAAGKADTLSITPLNCCLFGHISRRAFGGLCVRYFAVSRYLIIFVEITCCKNISTMLPQTPQI